METAILWDVAPCRLVYVHSLRTFFINTEAIRLQNFLPEFKKQPGSYKQAELHNK
jgi:hypothetical protein